MNNNRQVFIFSLFSLLKLSNYFILASNLPSGSEISNQNSSENLKDNIADCNHEMPLDLTVRDMVRSQKDISLQIPLSNSIKQNNPTLFSENQLTFSSSLFQSKEMISDPLINSTIQEINERRELKKYFVISKRSLRFFITKNNVHNILTSELNPDSFSRLIRLHRQKLLIPKLTMLNVKIDVIETLAELFFKNVTGGINSSFFKTEFGFEIFLTNLTSIMKSKPIHVKADLETRFKLGDFSQILYQVYLKPSISFSMSMISRYIKSNHNKFSLKNLLNTLISVVLESKNIQNDLKSIAFTILFFYNHADKKLIKNMDFIVKDMMIKIISLVNLYKIIEEDADQFLQKKQKFYDNIEREIKKSFVMAFYLRDLKLAMSNIDALKDEILHSKLALKVDFSFVVILLKTFKTVHCLKSILHSLKYESCEPLAEEARLSVKKMFEFKESLFDVFKKVL